MSYNGSLLIQATTAERIRPENMTNEDINYQNNPLHGLGLKDLLVELVDHYGFEILFAYLNINCFKTKPSIESSIKFLKKTKWAREKVEGFYLYQYKNLPRASDEQFALSPRDRVIPDHQQPGEPAELSLEDAARLQEKRAKKAAEKNQRSPRKASPYGDRNKTSGKGSQSARSKPNTPSGNTSDPWANWKS